MSSTDSLETRLAAWLQEHGGELVQLYRKPFAASVLYKTTERDYWTAEATAHDLPTSTHDEALFVMLVQRMREHFPSRWTVEVNVAAWGRFRPYCPYCGWKHPDRVEEAEGRGLAVDHAKHCVEHPLARAKELLVQWRDYGHNDPGLDPLCAQSDAFIKERSP